MSTEVSKAANAVPGLAGLAAGLRRTKNAMPSFGGKGYLAFGNDGMWTLGKDKRTSRTGERVVMNVNTLKSGYVCWTNYDKSEKKKNEKLGEEMKLATMGGVDPSTLPDTGWEWKQQQAIEGRFMLGDQEEFTYNTSSLGGLEAMDTLLDAIMGRIEEGEEVFLFPVIELSNDWYEHKQYGKTYKPIFEIVGWADVEGTLEGEAEEPKKVTKKKTEKPVEKEPEPEEEVDETEAEEEDQVDETEEAEAEEEQETEAPVRRRRR